MTGRNVSGDGRPWALLNVGHFTPRFAAVVGVLASLLGTCSTSGHSVSTHGGQSVGTLQWLRLTRYYLDPLAVRRSPIERARALGTTWQEDGPDPLAGGLSLVCPHGHNPRQDGAGAHIGIGMLHMPAGLPVGS